MRKVPRICLLLHGGFLPLCQPSEGKCNSVAICAKTGLRRCQHCPRRWLAWWPAVTVFVASKAGFVVDDFSIAARASGLRAALERDGVEPHPRHRSEEGFFVAGYDPPFRLSGRHTEVWMAASEEDDGGEDADGDAGDAGVRGGSAYTS